MRASMQDLLAAKRGRKKQLKHQSGTVKVYQPWQEVIVKPQ